MNKIVQVVSDDGGDGGAHDDINAQQQGEELSNGWGWDLEVIQKYKIVSDILSKIGKNKFISEIIEMDDCHRDILLLDDSGLLASIHSFLFQEICKFNILLKLIKTSIDELTLSLNGKITITDETDKQINEIWMNEVPSTWKNKSYIS